MSELTNFTQSFYYLHYGYLTAIKYGNAIEWYKLSKTVLVNI